MKREWHTTIGAAIFLAILCVAYWLLSYEDTGTTLLLFGGAAYLLLAGYLVLQWQRRGRIPRSEDKEDGSYEEGAGEPLGFFPAASIWPAGMGLGAIFIGVALIWGNWYFLPGGILFFGSVIGFTVEAEAPDDDPADAVQAAHRTDSTVSPETVSH
jgi:hypothetical protein